MIDKSRGLKIIVDGVKYYKGLSSSGSLIGNVNGKEIYFPALYMLCFKGTVEEAIKNYLRFLKRGQELTKRYKETGTYND